MFTTPTIAQLRQSADDIGLAPSDEYLEATQRIVAPLVRAYQALDQMADEMPSVGTVRLKFWAFFNRRIVVENRRVSARFMGGRESHFQPNWR